MVSHLEILRNHGETTSLYEHSLQNALDLASGHLPLVVVMQEPCNLADTASYENMVYGDDAASLYSVERVGCPALQEVERLAEEASADRYGLEDFSVFDINTLLSPDMQDDSKNLEADLLAAHQTFWDMIKALAPKVILVLTCTAGESQHKPVRLLSSSLKLAGSSWSREDVRLANQVLRLCFAKAFIGLSSEDPVELEDTELLQAWRAQLKAQEDLRAVEENLGNILTLN